MTLKSEGPLDGLEVVAWDVAPKGLPAEPTKSHSFVIEIERQGGVISPLVTLAQASSVIAGLTAERDEAVDRAKVWEHYWSQEVKVKSEVVSWAKEAMDKADAAEARISSLEEQNKRLREALEPFAAVAEHDIGDDETDDDIFWPISNARYSMSARLRVGHLRAARQALEDHNG